MQVRFSAHMASHGGSVLYGAFFVCALMCVSAQNIHLWRLGRQLIFQNGGKFPGTFRSTGIKDGEFNCRSCYRTPCVKDLSVVAVIPEFTGRPRDYNCMNLWKQ